VRRTGEAGFGLLEVAVAVAVLAVALCGLFASLGASVAARGASDDTEVARAALRSKLEEMRASDFSTFFSAWSGYTWPVAGLLASSRGAAAGSITLLTEAQASAFFRAAGGPGLVDLDGNGVFDEVKPAAAGWRAYAVRASILWGDKTCGADRTLDVTTIVYDRGT
jgi:prepilin-type N-terminal cleavage/methylation domain-containing protein